jgi:glycosyltransferase involved in cell wall biosynthesis
MTRITYVVDDPSWVQGARKRHLERHIPGLELDMHSASAFARKWPWLRRRRRPVYFGSWRILRQLRERLKPRPEEAARFMVSVTSHYNLGGGLSEEKALAGATDAEAVFREAVETLRSVAVVTVNSRRLFDLLEPEVPGLICAPNGVDVEFFRPPPRRDWGPSRITVGWIGKRRAAKNHELLHEVVATLAPEGFRFEAVVQPKDVPKTELLTPEALRELYRRIDFYLCTSWHEGTPNPALEAAACGAPLVTTPVGNMPELVRHEENGFFVDPELGSVAETLRGLRLLGAERYARLSEAIRKDIENDWTWARAAEAYREAFERLTVPAPRETAAL